MSQQREYEVVLQREPEGGFSVFVPELPSVATQGETRAEAFAMAKDAIEGYLQVMQEEGLPIPSVRARVGTSNEPAAATTISEEESVAAWR